jgi:1,2-phenylacetyl-CoA epoxidase PaaB subunit
MGEVAGIGFTVSLLINELAFAGEEERATHGTMAVLVGSLTAACLGAALMAWRNAVHRRRAAVETVADVWIEDGADVAEQDVDDDAVLPGVRERGDDDRP